VITGFIACAQLLGSEFHKLVPNAFTYVTALISPIKENKKQMITNKFNRLLAVVRKVPALKVTTKGSHYSPDQQL
jgi:hypothetical protein